MPDRYLIPATDFYRVEEMIKRSRFITSMAHAPDAESAKQFIETIRNEFPDATHNCWAYAAGPPGDTAHVGMSDDGEPHGTAGRPMLNMLLHSEVGELAVVVTRYFGGIKLGTGGLVRAYSGMVKLGVETLPVREKVDTVQVEAVFGYSHVTLFQRMLPDYEAEVLSENFGVDAAYVLRLPRANLPAFEAALTELTNGDALVMEQE